MNVVGCMTAYPIVPFELFEGTLAGQVIVDNAFEFEELLLLPRNGSFLPH